MLLETVYNGAIPASGAMILNVNAELSVDTEYLIDLKLLNMTGQIMGIQTLYIDLSKYDSDIEITSLDTKQMIKAKKGTQGYYPVLSTNLMKYSVIGNKTGIVPIFFLNFPVAVGVWGQAGNSGGGGIVPPTNYLKEYLAGGFYVNAQTQYLNLSGGAYDFNSELYSIENEQINLLKSGAYEVSAMLFIERAISPPEDVQIIIEFIAPDGTSSQFTSLPYSIHDDMVLPVAVPFNINSPLLIVDEIPFMIKFKVEAVNGNPFIDYAVQINLNRIGVPI